MDFNTKLEDAFELTHLDELDERLKTDTELKEVSATTKKTPPVEQDTQFPPPEDVYSNFRRQKVYCEDALRDYDGVNEEDEEDIGGVFDDAFEPDEQDEPGGGQVDLEEPDQEQKPRHDDVVEYDDADDFDNEPKTVDIPVKRVGNFTISQAKGQIDGALKYWMELSATLPDGQSDNFLSLGKSLAKISQSLNEFVEMERKA
jgi:hypothetical protein